MIRRNATSPPGPIAQLRWEPGGLHCILVGGGERFAMAIAGAGLPSARRGRCRWRQRVHVAMVAAAEVAMAEVVPAAGVPVSAGGGDAGEGGSERAEVATAEVTRAEVVRLIRRGHSLLGSCHRQHW